MKCRSLEAGRAADNESAMLWLYPQRQHAEQTMTAVFRQTREMLGASRHKSKSPLHLPVWGCPHSLAIPKTRSIYQPSSTMLPRALIGYVYPKGFVIRRVNNSGDISWHKGRVFVSQVLRFEDLGFELVAEDFYKVFFRDVEIGEFEV